MCLKTGVVRLTLYLKPVSVSTLSSIVLLFNTSGDLSGSTGEMGMCNGSVVVRHLSPPLDQSNVVIDRRSVIRLFCRFNDPIGMNSSDRWVTVDIVDIADGGGE